MNSFEMIWALENARQSSSFPIFPLLWLLILISEKREWIIAFNLETIFFKKKQYCGNAAHESTGEVPMLRVFLEGWAFQWFADKKTFNSYFTSFSSRATPSNLSLCFITLKSSKKQQLTYRINDSSASLSISLRWCTRHTKSRDCIPSLNPQGG